MGIFDGPYDTFTPGGPLVVRSAEASGRYDHEGYNPVAMKILLVRSQRMARLIHAQGKTWDDARVEVDTTPLEGFGFTKAELEQLAAMDAKESSSFPEVIVRLQGELAIRNCATAAPPTA